MKVKMERVRKEREAEEMEKLRQQQQSNEAQTTADPSSSIQNQETSNEAQAAAEPSSSTETSNEVQTEVANNEETLSDAKTSANTSSSVETSNDVQTEAANNQQTSNSTVKRGTGAAADPSRREPAKAKKYPVIQKTKDAERVAGFCDMSDEFNHDIKALQANDPLTFLRLRQDVVEDMKNPKARQS